MFPLEVLLSMLMCVTTAEDNPVSTGLDIGLIPAPVRLERHTDRFVLNEETRIFFREGDGGAEKTAAYLGEVLRPATGYALPAGAAAAPGSNVIGLRIEDTGLGNEGYRLTVTKSGVMIAAESGAGLFYGVQTLRQLMPPAIFSPTRVEGESWTIPAVSIEDFPRFAWRGMMLDVARHFQPKAFIKKFIDAIALHKMNRLHLHLTDDQGWRIEIKKYPKLTEVGAWRAETVIGHASKQPQRFDGTPHGGFYTQDEIRELVAYAAERHIAIIPEIEMPGHAQAAIAAYPELGNVSEPLPVHTSWGVNKNIFNADESTILFLQDVLSEVIGLFPSEYIHIGGDEAVKDQWEASEAVQTRMRNLELPDEAGMQSYFIARMNDFLTAKGRKLIGWDEILEGGLGKDATVMAWRGVEKGVEAARAGNAVVMAPTTFTYFDYYQGRPRTEPLAIGGYLPLRKVYSFDPVPEGLGNEETGRILGTQGQLWGEYISNSEHAEYMAFPRTCALAEVAWTPQEHRNFDGFLTRLGTHVRRLERAGIGYRELSD